MSADLGEGLVQLRPHLHSPWFREKAVALMYASHSQLEITRLGPLRSDTCWLVTEQGSLSQLAKGWG